MLHEEVVERETLELLRRLEKESLLADFHLAGGTALALYEGHRKSIDLDLFTCKPFDAAALAAFLEQGFGCRVAFVEKNTVKGVIDGVKVDCITHAYDMVAPVFHHDGLRLFPEEDIAAMKLSAISDNGTRLKDFIDVAALSVRYPLVQMLDFYEKKYPAANRLRPIKGLTYFHDIDFSDPVSIMKGSFSWPLLQERLEDMVRNQNRVFRNTPFFVEDEKRGERQRIPEKRGRGL